MPGKIKRSRRGSSDGARRPELRCKMSPSGLFVGVRVSATYTTCTGFDIPCGCLRRSRRFYDELVHTRSLICFRRRLTSTYRFQPPPPHPWPNSSAWKTANRTHQGFLSSTLCCVPPFTPAQTRCNKLPLSGSTLDSLEVTPKQTTYVSGVYYMTDYDSWLHIHVGCTIAREKALEQPLEQQS